MRGLMQDWPLLVHKIIDHAAQYHRGARIVTRLADGSSRRTDYAAIRVRARKLSAALARRGIKPGDRVATLAWNTDRHLECWYSVTGLGAVYHTLNPRLFPEQIAWIANDGGAKALFFDACFAPLLERIAPSLRHVKLFVAMDDEGATAKVKLPRKPVAYEDFIAGARERAWAALNENDACGLCHTSGTTGDPKGVLYSHRSNVLHAMMAGLGPGLSMTPQDVMLPVVPMFHANFWAIGYIAPMVGASLVLPGPKPSPASLYRQMEAEGVTLTAGVPTVWQGLLQYLDTNGLKPTTLRRVVIGGAAAPLSMIQTFEDRYGIDVVHSWGMTEMSPVGVFGAPKPPRDALPRDERHALLTRQGYPLFGVEMKITGDKGEERARDGVAVGRLKVRGPAVAKSYYKGRGKAAFDRDGWFDTGDVASIDAHGHMAITDRSKDVIKSGGEWISSVQIETLAAGHPAVAEAAVIAIAHPKWGERPLLVAALKPGRDCAARDILNFLSGKIARWWMPDAVVFVDEIPHSATGKILKTELRARFAGFGLPS